MIEEELKSGQLKNSYLLFGEENYLKIYYKNRLKSAIIGEDDVNFSYFEGKGIDVDEVIAIAETLPFFAEKRCVIVENSEWFLNGNEKMGGYIENLLETTCLIFIEGEKIDKRKQADGAKKVARLDKSTDGADGKKYSCDRFRFIFELCGQ